MDPMQREVTIPFFVELPKFFSFNGLQNIYMHSRVLTSGIPEKRDLKKGPLEISPWIKSHQKKISGKRSPEKVLWKKDPRKNRLHVPVSHSLVYVESWSKR